MTRTDVELMNGYLQNVQNAAILFDCNHVRNVKIVFEISIFDQYMQELSLEMVSVGHEPPKFTKTCYIY